MGKEVERKFLVKGDFKPFVNKQTRIVQGYLSSVPERTVRVRIKGDKGFVTIKGIGNASGASRYEWEKEIPMNETEELLKICEPGVIDKTRYLVKSGAHTIEDSKPKANSAAAAGWASCSYLTPLRRSQKAKREATIASGRPA